jgi:hypothetical protein
MDRWMNGQTLVEKLTKSWTAKSFSWRLEKLSGSCLKNDFVIHDSVTYLF